MALSRLVAALADQLLAELAVGPTPNPNPSPSPSVGSVSPTTVAELPLVTVSIEGATSSLRSVGKVPGPIRTGALPVDVRLDLNDPVLHLGDEDVPLLSADRRLLQLPHGSIVRADGTDGGLFTGVDLLVRIGAATFEPVAGAPAAGQVQLDPAGGTLRFPSALAATGTVELGYFIGTWEVRVDRFSATTHLDVAAATQAQLSALVPRIESALAPERISVARGIRRIEPIALSASVPAFVAGAAAADSATTAARQQRMTFAIEFESIEPVIPSNGGPITSVDATVRMLTADRPVAADNPFVETFTIIREADRP